MKLISKKNKIAQMKIQEMAFVLIALFLLFSMAFIFSIKIKSSDLEVVESNPNLLQIMQRVPIKLTNPWKKDIMEILT